MEGIIGARGQIAQVQTEFVIPNGAASSILGCGVVNMLIGKLLDAGAITISLEVLFAMLRSLGKDRIKRNQNGLAFDGINPQGI